MNGPTNEPSHEQTRELTKQMNLDAELPSNLSSKQVKYSLSSEQDAELPSEITDLINTQPCGLCHNNKSEPGLLLRQPVQYEEEIIQSSPAVNAFS